MLASPPLHSLSRFSQHLHIACKTIGKRMRIFDITTTTTRKPVQGSNMAVAELDNWAIESIWYRERESHIAQHQPFTYFLSC